MIGNTLEHTVKTEKNHMVFIIELLIFISLIFIKNVWDVEISETVLLVTFTIIAIFADKEEILALNISCVPLSSAFQYKYAILVGILIYCCKFYKDLKLDFCIFPLFLMMGWEVIHGFNGNFTTTEYFRGFAELMLVTFIMCDKNIKINYPLLARVLAFSTIAMCSIVLMNLLQDNNYNFAEIFESGYRFGVGNEDVENFGVNFNANALGFICNLSLVGLLQLGSLKKQKNIDYVIMAIVIFFGILTKSRSFIICCILVFVLFILSQKGKKGIKSIIGATFIIVAVYFIVATFAPYIMESILGRFQEQDVSGGRVDLIKFYNNHLMMDIKHLFFGIGMSYVMYKISLIHGVFQNTPHNGIQELLVVWGIPGLAMFIAFIISMIKSSETKHRLINYLPLLLIIIKVQSGQLITSGNTMLSFLIAYISLCVDFKGEELK